MKPNHSMASKNSDPSTTKRPLSLPAPPPRKTSQSPTQDKSRITKTYSPKQSFQRSGLSPKRISPTGVVVKDALSSRRGKTSSKESKTTSSYALQGDGVCKEHTTRTDGVIGVGREKDPQDGGLGGLNKTDGFWKLPTTRALARCYDDWEDTLPVATLSLCESVIPEYELDRTVVEEAPKSINEMFNHIINCLVINKGPPSPLKCSASTPECLGSLECCCCHGDKNMNHNNGGATDVGDDNNDIARSTTLHTQDDCGSDVIPNVQPQSHPPSSSSEHNGQPDPSDSYVDVSLDFEPNNLSSDMDVNDPPRRMPRAQSPNSAYSVFERARQMTRDTIQSVRSRSPTPQNVRDAFSTVVQGGKTLIQRSKDAIVAASCRIPNSDEEDAVIIRKEERIEMSVFSQFEDHDQQLIKEKVLNMDPPVIQDELKTTNDMSDKESLKPVVNVEQTMPVKLSEDMLGFEQVMPCPQTKIVSEVHSPPQTSEVPWSDDQQRCSSGMDANGLIEGEACEMKLTNSLGHAESGIAWKAIHHADASFLFHEVNGEKNLFGDHDHDDVYDHKDVCECDLLPSSELANESKANTNEEEVKQEVTTGYCKLESPQDGADKVILFKSSMSDVPCEEAATESEDVPRKTISLVASNEADQDRDITEVMALISDEASLKRYASVHDLTDLEREQTTSLSFTSNGKNRRMNLKDVVLEIGNNPWVTDNKGRQHEVVATGAGRDIQSDPGEEVSAEEIKKLFVNVIDPTYDTDDDQRSSDLSSCDDPSTQSSGHKKISSSSLGTPPNSPRLGIQTDAVATIISLFETNSILCASSAPGDEDKMARQGDYRSFENEEEDSSNCEDDEKAESGGCLQDHVDNLKLTESTIDEMVDDLLQDGAKHVERSRKEDVDGKIVQQYDDGCDEREAIRNLEEGQQWEMDGNQVDGLEENRDESCVDIERLVARLPSPPTTELKEDDLGSSVENDVAIREACTSKHLENDGSSNCEILARLREAFQLNEKESLTTVAVLDEIRQDLGNSEKEITNDEIASRTDIGSQRSMENYQIVKGSITSDMEKLPELEDCNLVRDNDVPLIANEALSVCPEGAESNTVHLNLVCSLECVDQPTNGREDDESRDVNDVVGGDSETNTVNVDKEANEPITTDVVKRGEKLYRTDVDVGSYPHGNDVMTEGALLDTCHGITGGETIVQRDDTLMDSGIDEVDKDTNTGEACVDLQSEMSALGHEKSSGVTTCQLTDAFPRNDRELDNVNVHDHLLNDKPEDFNVKQSGTVNNKPVPAPRKKTVLHNVQNGDCKDEGPVEHSDFGVGPSQVSNGVIPNGEGHDKTNRVDNEACTSRSNDIVEKRQFPGDPETIHPILLPRKATTTSKRPQHPAKITWALERNSSKKQVPLPAIMSEKGGGRDEDFDDDEISESDVDSYNRCNSCQPKQLSSSKHSDDERKHCEDNTNTSLVGNSSKMAQFILYTGALLPDLPTDVPVSKIILNDDPGCHNCRSNTQVHETQCQPNPVFHEDIQRLADLESCTGEGDALNHLRHRNVKVNSPRNNHVECEMGDKPPKASNYNSITKSKTLITKPIKKFTPYTNPVRHARSFPLTRSYSFNLATTNNQNNGLPKCSTSLIEDRKAVYTTTQEPLPLSVSSLTNMSKTVETTRDFLDRMSERMETSLAGIQKTCGFIDRAQKHLSRCDSLIGRSTETLRRSSQLSALVREQMNRVDLFLASERLNASPQRTTRK